MNSKNQQVAIRHLLESGEATLRELAGKICIAKLGTGRQTAPKSVVVQECRHNWNGYLVHKISRGANHDQI